MAVRSPSEREARWESRRLLTASFAVVAAGCLAVTAFALTRALSLERHAGFIVYNTLASVQLLARIDLDVARERLLVNQHIHTLDRSGMSAIEAQREQVDSDLQSTMKAFEPLVLLPSEREAWGEAKSRLGVLAGPVQRVLELSWSNHNDEARAALAALRPQFDSLDSALAHLTTLNDQEAAGSLRSISALRGQLVATFLGIAAVTLLGLTLVWRWASAQVSRREQQAAEHARMLEERNHDLDAFSGHVAHDIRGPLGTFNLVASRLEQPAPDTVALAQLVRRGVHRMEALTSDLLALARVEGVHGECDPAVVASVVESELSTWVEDEKGALRVSVDHAAVKCSEGLLRQVLENLVGNALKYRRPDVAPEISVSGAPARSSYDLRVADNGVGMTEEDAARLFEPFYRAARTRDLPGTGLGLAIVRRVADACGGSVSVSTRLGQGSAFVVHLPLSAAHEGVPAST